MPPKTRYLLMFRTTAVQQAVRSGVAIAFGKSQTVRSLYSRQTMSSRDGNLMFSDEVLECPKRGEAEAGLPLENWRHYGQLQRADSSKQVADLTRAGDQPVS
jgi:hypothetical protein